MTKTYTENTTENVTVTDTDETTVSVDISIKNIDKIAPELKVSKQLSENKRSNKVTITANEVVKEVSGWTLSTDKKVLSKTYTENTQTGGDKIEVEDLAGNKTQTVVEVTDIQKAEDLAATISYSTKALTNQDVKVTITANQKVAKVDGWTSSTDMKILTKTYSENTADAGENVKLTDEDGNDLIVNVKITNIDKKSPTIEVKYELATDKKSSKVTIKANEKIQEISGWTLSSDQMSLTKTYTKNTDSSGETIQIKDLAGNVQNAVVKIANIEEENKKDLKVNVEYKTKDGKVEAKIIANNKLQKVSGWTLSEDGLSLSKTYSANTEETVEVRDIYNNVAKVSIKVTTIKSNSTNNTNNNTTTTTNNNTTSAKSDNSTASKILPKTGIMRAIIAIVGIILVGIAIFLYKKNKYWKDI